MPHSTDIADQPAQHSIHEAPDIEEVDHKRARQQTVDVSGAHASLPSCSFVPCAGMHESMTQYFSRYRTQVEHAGCMVTESMDQPGLYLYKRPVRSPNPDQPNPLTLCGSVYHHCVLYWKMEGGEVVSLDFGPANAGDVTANIMAPAPARACLSRPALLPGADPAEQLPPGGKPLPYLYLGEPVMGLEDARLTTALRLAESRPYHALKNNCIHFADALTRLLSDGRVAGAPLLYDIMAGDVPGQDNPMVLMMSMMLQASWFSVCDGSVLAADMARAAAGKLEGDADAPQPAATLAATTAAATATATAAAITTAAVPAAPAAAAAAAMSTAAAAAAPAPAAVSGADAGVAATATLISALAGLVGSAGSVPVAGLPLGAAPTIPSLPAVPATGPGGWPNPAAAMQMGAAGGAPLAQLLLGALTAAGAGVVQRAQQQLVQQAGGQVGRGEVGGDEVQPGCEGEQQHQAGDAAGCGEKVVVKA